MDFASIKFQPNRPLLREISADRLNTILQEIKRNKPKGERGITVRQDGTGTYVGLAASLGKPTAAQPQPWDLIARRDAESSAYILTVQPGTLNGILPSNYDDQFTCSASGLFYAKAVLTTDGRDITGVTIAIDQTAPTIQDAQPFAISTTIEMLFGLFSDGEKLRVVGDGHITMQSQVWLTAEKQAAPAVGELPWVNYYRLT